MTRITADWIGAPGSQAILDLLTRGGHQGWFVGGCVRDGLLGRPVSDIDVATDARPQRVMALAADAGLRALPTGVDHGTVTVISGTPHEVTTFRRDVATDGRRAVVAFSTDIRDDAARRDFTVNALYADAGGQVADPLGTGLADLHARRIRFIGDAADRLAEDTLRLLRFFRFTAAYGDPELGVDAPGLAAAAGAVGRLAALSRERVGAEMRRLLDIADPFAVLDAMAEIGALAAVLPGAVPGPLPALLALERRWHVPPRWLRRLAALWPDDASAALRLSRAEARDLAAMLAGVRDRILPHEIAQAQGTAIAEDVALLTAARGADLPANWQEAIAAAAAAVFPVSAQDLLPRYGQGPELGAALADLRRAWIDSRFALDRAALLRLDAGER
ncbi:MAG: CCA tRNA nucleotidyltransferase [Pseudomonadota bacterium]